MHFITAGYKPVTFMRSLFSWDFMPRCVDMKYLLCCLLVTLNSTRRGVVLQGRVSDEDKSKNDMQKDMNDQETRVKC